MTLKLALRWLLPLLAVISLALTPVTASAANGGMRASMTAQMRADHEVMDGADAADGEAADIAMDDMPCCPPGNATMPDCAKAGCQSMALCFGGIASPLPGTASVPLPVATRASRAWPDAAAFVSVHGPPLSEPPRS